MINRRKFIKTMSALGISIPAMAKSITKKSSIIQLLYVAVGKNGEEKSSNLVGIF